MRSSSSSQDGVAEASALVLGQDGHVDDVEVPAAVADDPAHADDGARLVVHDVARRPAATDGADGLVLGDGGEAGHLAKIPVVGDERRSVDKSVAGWGVHGQ